MAVTYQQDIVFGPFRLDKGSRSLTRDGIPVLVGGRALDVLVALAAAAGETVGKRALLNQIWSGLAVEENNLYVHISALRKALGEGWIVTVPNHGYRLHYLRPGLALPGRTSIVVYPFGKSSGELLEGCLAEGITEDLTTDLSRLGGVVVIAPNAAVTYNANFINVTSVGRELGARYILQGSVRQVGDQARVNAHLIDTESGEHLWADRFDTCFPKSINEQNAITGRLARALKLALVADENRRISHKDVTNLEPKELNLRGKAALTQTISQENYKIARDYFERALALDPSSVDAQIGTAGALLANLAEGWSGSPQQDCVRIEQLVFRNVSYNSNFVAARVIMGVLRRFQNRLPESQIELEAAIALESGNATAICQLGFTFICLGQPEAGIVEIERGIRLGPQEAHTPVSYCMLGLGHLLLGHTDQAIELARKSCAANSRLYYVYLTLAAALGLKEDLHSARAALAEAVKLKPDVKSLTSLCAAHPWFTNHRHMELAAKTLNVGLLRAGMPAV